MLLFGCTTLPYSEAATALVAAIVAATGTLAAKHRPAGAATRSTDRGRAGVDELATDDELLRDYFAELEPVEPLADPLPGRVRAAVRRLGAPPGGR